MDQAQNCHLNSGTGLKAEKPKGADKLTVYLTTPQGVL